MNVTRRAFSRIGARPVRSLHRFARSLLLHAVLLLSVTSLDLTGILAAQSDVTPPQLTAFGFTPTSIDTTTGPANVTVNFTVTDDLSGATRFDAFFQSPSGSVERGGSSGFAAAGSMTGSVVVSFPQFSEAGIWSVVLVRIDDAAGNIRRLVTSDLVAGGFPTTLNVVAVQDVVAPHLTAFSFTPTSIDTTTGPANVTVNFTVTDELSGATRFDAFFQSPSGSIERGGSSGFAAAGSMTGSVVVSFPQFSEAGIWSVILVRIDDAAGNTRRLVTSDLVAGGFPTTLNVVAVQDVVAPDLTAFSFTPTSIDTTAGPANVTVNFTVTDELSGATRFDAFFQSPSGSIERGGSSGFAAAGRMTGSVVVSFPQFSEAGTWSIVLVRIDDAAGNIRRLVTSDLVTRGFPTKLLVAQKVSIDIKPGSFPNSVNPKDQGTIPVALLTTANFNASTVNVESVRFGPTGTEAVALRAVAEDVDGDGRTDMVFHFRTQDTGIVCGTTSGSLTGKTLSGQPIRGTDSIRTVGCN